MSTPVAPLQLRFTFETPFTLEPAAVRLIAGATGVVALALAKPDVPSAL